MSKIVVDGLKTHYEDCGRGICICLIHGAQGTVERLRNGGSAEEELQSDNSKSPRARATVKIIQGAGHSSMVEKPKELSEVITKFLRKHEI